jgi:hypothetical protein
MDRLFARYGTTRLSAQWLCRCPTAPELLAAAAFTGMEPVRPELRLALLNVRSRRRSSLIVGLCHGRHASPGPGPPPSWNLNLQPAGRLR